MPAQFKVPEVEDNEEGWGPTSVPDHLSGVPYAPFGKSDKVGRISDFTQTGGKYGGKEVDCSAGIANSTPYRTDMISHMWSPSQQPDRIKTISSLVYTVI